MQIQNGGPKVVGPNGGTGAGPCSQYTRKQIKFAKNHDRLSNDYLSSIERFERIDRLENAKQSQNFNQTKATRKQPQQHPSQTQTQLNTQQKAQQKTLHHFEKTKDQNSQHFNQDIQAINR